jgi:hypothetical protein
MANDFAATIGNLINVQRIASSKNEVMRLETYVLCLPPDARLDRDTIYATIADELKLLYHYAGKLESGLLYDDTIAFIKFRNDDIVK